MHVHNFHYAQNACIHLDVLKTQFNSPDNVRRDLWAYSADNLVLWSVFKIEVLIWASFWRVIKFQLFSWRIGLNPRRSSKNIETKYKPHINLCMHYMVHVCSTIWRTKYPPSNSISCSGNALRLLVLVTDISYWGLQVTMSSSFSIWGCVLKSCFERGRYILKGQIAFKRHRRLQSWTLVEIFCLINIVFPSSNGWHRVVIFWFSSHNNLRYIP